MEPRDERLLAQLQGARQALLAAMRELEKRRPDGAACPACGALRHPLDLRSCLDCGREVCRGCRCACADVRAVLVDPFEGD